MVVCQEGHLIAIGANQCEHGHAAVVEQMPTMAQMMEMMNRQMSQMQMQMEQQRQQAEASESRERQLREALQAASQTASQAPIAKIDRPKRPSLEYGAQQADWEVFHDSWCRYKEIAGFHTDAEMRYELRATCSGEINSMLLGTIGRDALNVATEEELLANIKSVAVIIMHKEVHRQNFTRLQQSENESITHFVARLKSAAQLCDFSIANPTGATMVSFAEEMVATQMISGL